MNERNRCGLAVFKALLLSCLYVLFLLLYIYLGTAERVHIPADDETRMEGRKEGRSAKDHDKLKQDEMNWINTPHR